MGLDRPEKNMQAINIVTIVDVIGALSSGALRDNLYMADNGWGSAGKGTAELATACYPGQRINWVVNALDVQTAVLIDAITFLNPDSASAAQEFVIGPGFGGTPQNFYWAGFVPCYLPPGRYGYRLKLQMGRGDRSTMSIDTPVLNVQPLGWSGAAS
jgi:hypothetical protein